MELPLATKAALNHAGDKVATLSPEKWEGCLCYLLELLDDCTAEDQFRLFLQALHRDIAARLERGRW